MTDEERQRQMDFILRSQAQSEVRLDRLERVLKLLVRAGRRERRAWRESHDALLGSQIALVESQRTTDESIKNLTAVVDRYFSERRNGNGGG